jgi:hypothetical protein
MKLKEDKQVVCGCSSHFEESNHVCLFSEASSACHELILSDETVGGVANSACS